ncbi:endoplasmic reticulum protein [Macrolepiota fuliginosa MF-IS2]|uniref:ER membrane protein complex subunit 4 n=1 Tax=Macrolepiota fuliginosa MF-IS2 TaxID=1400762 RepID=A0A9P5WZR1_9AGAR|nr:endoplasmic reticulum protein [Macrolepiota fuliginosa MF-IS2]
MSTTVLDYSSLENSSKWKHLPPPPGFSKQWSASSKTKTEGTSTKSLDSLKASRAWDVAIQPAKQIPMNLIMLYMSGSQVQIFSMGVIVMLLWGPFVNFFKANATFAQYAPEGKDPKAFTTLFLQKAVFLLFHLVGLAIGLWKCQQMGLLPTGTGDWLAFETRGLAPEISLFS